MNKNGIIYENGKEMWFLNGVLSRDDGPAVVYSNGFEHWLVNGIRHRKDGPAIYGKRDNGTILCQWWYDGEHLSFDAYCEAANISQEEKFVLALTWHVDDENNKVRYSDIHYIII